MTTRQLSHNDQNPILVIGASAKTGRRVSDRLRARGLPTRAVSRTSEVPFDWGRPDTWPAALEGVRSAYVTYQPDLSLPSALTSMTALLDVAVTAGVERFVLLSGRGEPGAQACEEAVMSALPESTTLTCAWFAQNFSEGMLRDAVLSGAIVLPVDPAAVEPFLDVEDIAAVAVAALTDEQHRGGRYELTGPAALSFGEVAAILSLAARRPVEFVPVTGPEFVAGALDAGMPSDEAEMLVELFGEVLDGRNSATTRDVARVLGRPATSFATFAQQTAADGAWDHEAEQAS